MAAPPQKVVECFEKMDITLLEVCLDENKTYQALTLPDFLDKINKAFNLLQNKDDKKLISCTGKCISEHCPNKGLSGYSFLAPNSNRRLDLIFEIENETLLDICHCNDFCKDDASKNDNSNLVIIKMYEDEAVDFVPNDYYLRFFKNCQTATAQFETLLAEKGKLSVADFVAYYKTHYALAKNVKGIFNNYESYKFSMEFLAHFNEAELVVELLKFNHDANVALYDYDYFAEDDKAELKSWLKGYWSVFQEINKRMNYQEAFNYANGIESTGIHILLPNIEQQATEEILLFKLYDICTTQINRLRFEELWS